jgi:hypothetical protein
MTGTLLRGARGAGAAARAPAQFFRDGLTDEAVLQGVFINGLDRDPHWNFNIADSSIEEASWRT